MGMTKNTNVLFYAPFVNKRFAGGPTVTAKILEDNIQKFTHQDVHLSFFNSSPLERKDSNRGKICFENFINYFLVKKEIKKILQDNRIDIIHVNSSVKLALLKDLVLIKFLKRKYNIKILLHIRYADLEQVVFRNKFLKWIMLSFFDKYVDRVISLSKKFKDELVAAGLDSSRISVLYNFQNYTIQMKKQHEEETTRILFLGSLEKRKGIWDMISILDRITSAKYHVQFAGSFFDKETENIFMDTIKSKRWFSKVNFSGYITGDIKKDTIMDSDIFILPTYGEGMPIAILESMALGCVIISTTVGAIPEIIKEGENGFLFQPGDVKGMSEAINRLMDHKDTMRQIQKNNIEKAKDFTVDTFIRNLIGIYKNTLEEELL